MAHWTLKEEKRVHCFGEPPAAAYSMFREKLPVLSKTMGSLRARALVPCFGMSSVV
jgi:hypothetical protein